MTITVSIPDEVMKPLAEKAIESGQPLEEFVQDVLRREAFGRPDKTVVEILAPFRKQVEESGMTDDDLDTLFSKARIGESNFFSGHSLDELADLQGIKILQDASILSGGIPETEDIDEELREIYESRR